MFEGRKSSTKYTGFGVKEPCLDRYGEKLGPLTSTLPSRLLWLKVRDTNLNLICSRSAIHMNYSIWGFKW